MSSPRTTQDTVETFGTGDPLATAGTGDAAGLTIDVTLLPADSADRGPTAVVVLTGRLDAVEAVRLRQEFATVVQAGTTLLLVDLSDVRFVDSAGLAALVRARREVGNVGGTTILVSPTVYDARRVFRLTQFDEVFRMVEVRSAQ